VEHADIHAWCAVWRQQLNACIVQADVARPTLDALQAPDCSQGASTSGGCE
jgi:hypothetical protein